MTPYQKAINKASLELAKEDCGLLQNRGELFALSRKKVNDEGYSYGKKMSRSTSFGKGAMLATKTKRKYMQSSMREENIKNVSSAIQSQEETIALLQRQEQKYSNAEKYLEAAEINKSILEISLQKQLKVKELAELSKAEARSNIMKKRKKTWEKKSKNLPKAFGAWLNKESSVESGGDTDILESDESGNEVNSDKQAADSGRKEALGSSMVGDLETVQKQQGPAELQRQAEVYDQGNTSSENHFLQ